MTTGKRAVVTTTIYPPANLLEWVRCLREGDVICVSGDKKTPHVDVMKLLNEVTERFKVTCTYSAAHNGWASGEVVGWNSIQRRNVAILDALGVGDVTQVTTVDTDNYPLELNYIDRVEALLSGKFTGAEISTPLGWLNVGAWVSPPVVHRGLPLKHRHNFIGDDWEFYEVEGLQARRVAAFSSLWVGDPDIDAIERLHGDPISRQVLRVEPFTLARDTWSPYNSQATTLGREFLPLLCVWPGVGRMDDIWASYAARHVIDAFDARVAYGAPAVNQERHPHDVIRDLEAELLGYRHTLDLVEAVRSVDLSEYRDLEPTTALVRGALRRVLDAVERLSFIPQQTREFFAAWQLDLTKIYDTRGEVSVA